MSVRYSGGPYLDTTHVSAGINDMIEWLSAQLATVNWVQGGVVNNRWNDSGPNNLGGGMSVHIYDDGGSMAVHLANPTHTYESGTGGNSLKLTVAPADTWRLIASPVMFCLFVPGSVGAYKACILSGLYQDTPLAALNHDVGYGEAHTASSHRTVEALSAAWACFRGVQGIHTGGLVINNPYALKAIYPTSLNQMPIVRWADDSYIFSDPLVSCGITGIDADARIHGQLYDLIATSSQAAMETEFDYDGHRWLIYSAVYANGRFAVCRGII